MASITRRGKRWRALVRKQGTIRSKTFDTKSSAQKWATRLEADIDAGAARGTGPTRGITVADLIDRYVRELKPRKRWGNSKEANLVRLRRDCGHWKAQQITATQIIDYCTERAEQNAGPATVNGDLSYLGSVLRVARSVWRLDVPDVIKDARMALGLVGIIGKSQQRDRRPTQQELDRLCDYFARNLHQAIPMHDIIRFAVGTAMRLGEIVNIKWEDVDVESRTVLIRDRKHPTEKLGNNQKVPLLFESDLIVKRQPRNSDRVFPFNAQSCSRAFQRATAALNIDDLTFHDLRHEGTTRLFEAGFRIEQVALVTGHRDWGMLRRYVQLRAEDLHDVVQNGYLHDKTLP